MARQQLRMAARTRPDAFWRRSLRSRQHLLPCCMFFVVQRLGGGQRLRDAAVTGNNAR